MHLLTLIFGIVLLPKTYTLTCYQCVPGSSGTCTGTTKQCPLRAHQCRAARITSYIGDSKLADVNIKTCALDEQCLEGAVNFGITRTVITSKCCATDLCNSEPAAEPSLARDNGLKCHRCDGQKCSTLNCKGNEDHCISAAVNLRGEKKIMKGCASEKMCSDTANAQIAGAIPGETSCCQGDFCNSASSKSAGLLLLVAPLFSLVMFS
ncbi:urokinase plasminogen activator surface receptor-like [Micropterus dolomieu]|uniref:urokinase plasminogen activator surface receptor-like n=1 Tax=Micropterus dolomieu TaxID=147949 RepID=UPI001E8DE085|nr:urokinase plasminogen activator surface receptor-like [Micropterus dolomieu]